MLHNGRPGTWLSIGLVGSVLFRGTLWVLTTLNLAPLLGPVDLLLYEVLEHPVGTAVWLGDIIASFLFAVVTGVVCGGLRGDRAWAYRWGQGLARFYVVLNLATATVTGALMWHWGPPARGFLAVPFAVYLVSIAVAVMAARELTARRGAAVPEDRQPALDGPGA
ncbi:hypothetical protein [Micromonospora maritima]|uniref:Uncharacterized protein n=1 Tax=Micromonospora maritima TaxID=986711 RepID=A0ABW7ZQU0_9ACTN